MRMKSLKDWTTYLNQRSRANGWWREYEEPGQSETIKKIIVGAKFALIHSEISEALEAYRKDLPDQHLPHLSGVAVELADAFIRIADLAGELGIDLESIVAAKQEYNDIRPDHKLENRQLPGGKQF